DQKGQRINSAPQQIEVFPPFRLLPRKVTLITGATSQITSEGGPQPQPNIIFSISDEKIASVKSTGLVRGVALGNGTVTGLVQAVDAETGKLVVVSQEKSEGELLHTTKLCCLKGVTIGQEDTKHAVFFSEALSLCAVGAAGCPAAGAGSRTNLKAKSTAHDFLLSKASFQLPEKYNFAMDVYGRVNGRTGLKVVVKVLDPAANQFSNMARELSSEIQIQVFEKLHLVSPEVEAEQILMSPNSFIKLQTNR
ncbi:PO210 protein, partial [Bucco capensis]|nr:PO210 protein [Bucco capensis]